MSFVYLSIPYTSKNPDPEANAAERAARMDAFWNAVAYLVDRGDHVVSPMTLEPALTRVPDMPYDWPFWQAYSLKMLAICDKLVVLTLDGWKDSAGVKGEVEAAEGKAIEFLAPWQVNAWLATRKAVETPEPFIVDFRPWSEEGLDETSLFFRPDVAEDAMARGRVTLGEEDFPDHEDYWGEWRISVDDDRHIWGACRLY